LAQSSSFAEASDKLNLSQPALSIAIKNLEQTLGGTLITRSTRTLALTHEGRAFLSTAKRLMHEWENAFNDVSNMFSLKLGKLNIAAMPFFSASILPDILMKYHQQHPNITISLFDVVNENVIESVRSAKSELGICFNPGNTDDLEFINLYTEEYIAIIHPQNPLASKQKISWSELFKFPFLTLQNPASLRQDISEAMKANNIPFSVHIETCQLTTIGELVSTGLGVSAVPKSSIKQMKQMGLLYRPLINPMIKKNVGIIYRRRYELSVAAQTMKTNIINHCKAKIER